MGSSLRLRSRSRLEKSVVCVALRLLLIRDHDEKKRLKKRSGNEFTQRGFCSRRQKGETRGCREKKT